MISSVFLIVIIVGFSLSAVMLLVVIILFVRDDVLQAIRDLRQIPPCILGRERDRIQHQTVLKIPKWNVEDVSSSELVTGETGETVSGEEILLTDEEDPDKTVMLSSQELEDPSDQIPKPNTLMPQAALKEMQRSLRAPSQWLPGTYKQEEWEHFVPVQTVIVTHTKQPTSEDPSR